MIQTHHASMLEICKSKRFAYKIIDWRVILLIAKFTGSGGGKRKAEISILYSILIIFDLVHKIIRVASRENVSSVIIRNQ